MKLADIITKGLYKWVIFYPWLRKVLNWVYFDVIKMPQYHIALKPGQTGRYAILIEDPGEIKHVASYLDDSKKIAEHREYLTYTGSLAGAQVSVTSTGMGGPSAAIAVEELAKVGAEFFLFLGDGLRIQLPAQSGELVVAIGAVRGDGTGLQYIPVAFPALADLQICSSLRQACRSRAVPHRVGLVHSHDSYYDMVYPNTIAHPSHQGMDLPGIFCYDLNTATVFVVASALGKKAGALLSASNVKGQRTDEQIAVAIEALRLLIKLDA